MLCGVVAVCVRCKTVVEPGANFCPHCGTRMPLEPPSSRLIHGAEVGMENWGKVVLGDVIGQGGMGLVRRGWLYYDPQGPRAGNAAHPVAVKILHPFLLGRRRARELFLREAVALERLRHPNIVHFFGLVEQHGQLAIVIEFVEGQTLDSVIAQHGRMRQQPSGPALPFMLAWHYFAQLLGALSAVHQLGIIHRDVKPANILIRTDGIVKLTDFGIARVPQEAVFDTGGMAPGTGAYMAPEQVTGTELDARTDLYAAGIVLFRRAQLEQSPPPLTSLVQSAPQIMDLLLARALAKDKMHRYASGVEFGDAIQHALGLPEIEGWRAQKELVKHAKAISEMLPVHDAAKGRLDADQLRTDAMAAFKM
jgi:eukaryotic-like serine/threonine-protein kinase